MNEKVLVLFLLSFISIKCIITSILLNLLIIYKSFPKVSRQLYFTPDYTNPIIPLRWRQMCGYRYRPLFQNITYHKNCFVNTYDPNVMAFNPPIYPESPKPTKTRVLMGRDVTHREAPWAVEIASWRMLDTGQVVYNITCSGSLLTMKFILTAGHCQPRRYNERLAVFVGSDRRNRGYVITGFEFITHPNYIDSRFLQDALNDIAIIRLYDPIDWKRFDYASDPTKYSLINTICLPEPPEYDERIIDPEEPRYQPATFFGWGRADNDTIPDLLQRGDFSLRYFDNYDELFVSRASESRGCKGDSGAGVVQFLDESESRAVLIGVLVQTLYRRPPRNQSSPYYTNFFDCSDEKRAETIVVMIGRHLDWIYEVLSGD